MKNVPTIIKNIARINCLLNRLITPKKINNIGHEKIASFTGREIIPTLYPRNNTPITTSTSPKPSPLEKPERNEFFTSVSIINNIIGLFYKLCCKDKDINRGQPSLNRRTGCKFPTKIEKIRFKKP